MGVWKANDCLTLARSRALEAHLDRLTGPPPPRPRPGSYSWPTLRRDLEARYAAGATPAHITLHPHHPDCTAIPPSRRTLQRWHAQQRWVARPP